MDSQNDHNRIHEKLTDYWQELRGDRPFPTESDINPDSLADIWDACFLIQVQGHSFHYAYLGTSLIEAYGNDLTNRDVCDRLIEPASPAMVHKCAEVVKTKNKAVDESEFTNTLGMRIKYRSCLLPLGDDAGEINYILGGMRWKAC